MVQFIADHRAVFGVEPICAVLPIAPSTYHRHRHQRTHPTRRSARAPRDDRYCQVDEKLVDRPPRYWARARRKPAILGIKNGRRPQLDNTAATTADPRYTPSTTQREARTLDTQARYARWQTAYRALKQQRPRMSDVWYASQIAKQAVAAGYQADTIRRHMTGRPGAATRRG